ncbi:MAG: WD40 repeat domain-containing protein [Anaerolineae bacterium]|nr:WD40 repeat domain-containing protein [Anaerolineae bacterium]
MTDSTVLLQRLRESLDILQKQRTSDDADVSLHAEIDDHHKAITLTEQLATGHLTETDWREQLRPLLVTIEARQATEVITTLNIGGVDFSHISGSTITTGDIHTETTAGGDITGENKTTQSAHGSYIGQASDGGTVNITVYQTPEMEKVEAKDESPAPGESPYKGLQYFDVIDADLFFGRKALTAKLVNRLKTNNFLAVVGASGSGKSSLVRAGLVETLQRGEPLSDGSQPPKDSQSWAYHLITPTAHPLKELAASLTRHSESVRDTSILIDDLTADARSLDLAVHRLLSDKPANRLLLLVDQFEELFTLCKDEAKRQAFVDNLLTAVAEPDGPTTVVITLRADFYAHCGQYEQLRLLLAKQQEYIGPMSQTELRAAIEQPAERGDWQLEPGLVDLLLADVGREPGALPLLSHALLETWQRRRVRTMTLAGYAQAGRVQGAIAHTADRVYHELTPEQQQIARNVFLRLTELGEGTQDTRRRVALAELILKPELRSQVESVLKTLADARLIATSSAVATAEETEPPRLDENETAHAEVAHEALIREWPLLREWLNEDREALRTHRRLAESAQEWNDNARDPSFLYHGTRLKQAEEWATADDNLNALERAFLEMSITERNRLVREQEEQQQRELEAVRKLATEAEKRAEEQTIAARKLRIRARLLAVIGAVAAILAVFAIMIGIQSNQNATLAEQEAHKAKSRELAVAAEANLDKDIGLSVALGVFAISEAHTKEANEALRKALQSSRLQFVLSGHVGPVYDVAFSSDGDKLATTGEDGTVKVWDVVSGQQLQSLSTDNNIYGAAFNSDGTLLAISGGDGKVIIWDISSGQQKHVWKAHPDTIFDVAFSPNGTYLATASQDKSAKVWDVNSEQEIFAISNHITKTRTVAFSPDDVYLAVAWDDGNAEIWSTTTHEKLLSLSGHEAPINDIEFSPDGEYLVTVSDDKKIIFWKVTSGQVAGFFSDTSPVYGVSFSPTGMYFVTSNLDGAVKLWGVNSPQVLINFSEELNYTDSEDNRIYGVEFSPDGTRIATSRNDGKTRIWAIYGSEPIAVLGGHTDKVRDVAFSLDGQYLATASWDNTGKLWNATTGEELLTLEGHQDVLVHIVFNSNSTRILTASRDETARVWDTATGRELLALSRHTTGVHDVSFSPDETYTLTTGVDGTIKKWNSDSGEEISTFTPHITFTARIAFSPDGTRLATASYDEIAAVWNTTTWKKQLVFQGHNAGVDGVTFSPDGQRLATASRDHTAKIWDANSGQEIFTLFGHSSSLGDVVFSPDGAYLATASKDKTAKIWDANYGTELLTLFGHLDGVNELAFSPDGKHLATAGGDGVVIVHTLDIDELKQLALNHLRPLTTQECKKYLQQEPPCLPPLLK